MTLVHAEAGGNSSVVMVRTKGEITAVLLLNPRLIVIALGAGVSRLQERAVMLLLVTPNLFLGHPGKDFRFHGRAAMPMVHVGGTSEHSAARLSSKRLQPA